MRRPDEVLEECPACGGSGGGPFGRPGSAWDVEGYVCPRCRGAGLVRPGAPLATLEARPLAKGPLRAPAPAKPAAKKPGPARARPAAPREKRAKASGTKPRSK